MNALDCIKSRRSIRKYKKKEVPEEIINDILECGMKAPSSCNTQPWAFIVVKDKDKINALSKISDYSSFVADAPLCIVVCLTPEKLTFTPNKYHSVACAIENMLLAIHAHSLGSCWTFIKDFDDTEVEEKAKTILNIPKDVEAICMLPIGYPDEQPVKKDLKDSGELIHYETW
jgi:nitroreductase